MMLPLPPSKRAVISAAAVACAMAMLAPAAMAQSLSWQGFVGSGSESSQGMNLSQSLGDELWLGFTLSTPLERQEQQRLANLGGQRDDAVWELTTLQSFLAWQLNPQWSVEAGVDLLRAETHGKYPFRLGYDDDGLFGQDAAQTTVVSESWHSGLNLGMRYSLSSQTQLDWQYRSAMEPLFSRDSGSAKATAGTMFHSDSYLSSSASLGFSHQPDERWTLLGQYTRFDWDEAERHSLLMTDDHRDSWSLMLGSEYRFDPQWTLRGGVKFSEGLSSGLQRDSTSLAFGAAYRGSNRLSLEMAYTHELIRQQSLSIRGDEPDVTEGIFGNGHRFGLGLRYAF